MLLIDLLTPARTSVGVSATSKKRLLESLAATLADGHGDACERAIFDSLFAREKLGSTGLGQGVAIPHGRIKGLKEAHGAFLRLAAPVPFDSPDGKPVALLFVLLVPEQANELHLQILSELAQRFSERSFREALAAAPDGAAAHMLFAA